MPEALQVFIDKNVPQSSKKEKVVLGVSDAKLGAGISEALNITCQYTGAVPEILRGMAWYIKTAILNIFYLLVHY